MRFCGRCGRPLEKPMARERRDVSIVFIDLCGFTSLTREFDPERLRDLADQVLTIVAGIIEDYDGYVDAFQGDGLIALFGAPHSHHDDPHRAVHAAAAGLKAIEKIGETKGYILKGRAGVNTGTVIAGAVGSGRVREYTVMGSAVNLAARLEEAASAGEVWVGPETFEATRHRIGYETVTGLELQGFPNVTEAYRLESLNENSGVDPYQHLQFVGREAEMSQIQEAYQLAQTGHTQTCWLIGEAGSGKTRLAKEFAKRTSKSIWLEESHDIHYVWRQLAGQMFDLLEEDDRRWQRVINEQLKILLPNEPRWQVYILRSLNLLEDRPFRRLERRTSDRTFLAWRDWLSAWLKTQPETLILGVEHGSQGSSFGQFLDLLQATPLPLLIIRTSRRQELSPQAKVIPMVPLSLQESLALVEQVASPVMAVATRSLVLQVGGTPANLLELGRALDITPQGSFTASINSLLQTRLDMLQPAARRVLSYAALSGERSWESMLKDLSGITDTNVILQQLVEDNILIKENRSSLADDSEYRFQSELLRKAVLRMIPQDTDKTVLHLQIATWLEKHVPLELSAITAYHFKEGHAHEAAYPHYLAAADLAIHEGNVIRGYDYYDTLLKLDLPNALLAQAALSYAQNALYIKDSQRAYAQLRIAEAWIAICQEEVRISLQASHNQIMLELKQFAEDTTEESLDFEASSS
jgi:class 3 adenylate cyclase